MNNSLGDIQLNIPIELVDELSAVIQVGLQRAKISQEARKSLASWWEAERGLIAEELAAKPTDI